MASFTIYDPRTHAFRTLETDRTIDLPFDQVLMLNILIELRVLTQYLSLQDSDPPQEDPSELRANIVSEVIT